MAHFIDPKLKQLFDNLPGYWVCKNEDLLFTYSNDAANRNLMFFKHPEEVIGQSDFDLLGPARNLAKTFQEQDRYVMQNNKKLKILDVHRKINGEWHAMISHKTPLYNDNNQVVGTIFHGTDITQANMVELGTVLGRITADSVAPEVLGQGSYLVGNLECAIKLSAREQECLFFLLRGKTAKQIGQILGISPRTAEEHIVRLRCKFNVATKPELIDAAINQGFLSAIPERLFNHQLSIVLKED